LKIVTYRKLLLHLRRIAVLLLQGLLAARSRVLAHALDQEAAALVSLAASGSTR
jgi:hypothetical protein